MSTLPPSENVSTTFSLRSAAFSSLFVLLLLGARALGRAEGAAEAAAVASRTILPPPANATLSEPGTPSPAPSGAPPDVPPSAAPPDAAPSVGPLSPSSVAAPSQPGIASAWRHYIDLWALSAQVPGTRSATQVLNHEHNFDFAAALYAESAHELQVIVDMAGPGCFTYAFFAISATAAKNADLDSSALFVDAQDEEGGSPGWQNVGSVGGIFRGDFAADLGAGDVQPGAPGGWGVPARAPPLTRAAGWAGDLVPALPRPLAFNTNRAGDYSSGFSLIAPICAHSRLRIGFQHPHTLGGNAAALLQDGSDCVAFNKECAFAFYVNVQTLAFTGTRLPAGVAPFDARAPAFSASDERALPALRDDVARVWAPLRFFEEALAGGDAARSLRACGAVPLARGAAAPEEEGEWPIFSERGRPGTISLLWFDFPDAPHLLHSALVHLEATWDDGRGKLLADLEGLIGPLDLGDGAAPVRKESRTLGEMPRNASPECANKTRATALPLDSSAYCSGGFYLLLPMAWKSAARVRLVFSAGAAAASTAPPPHLGSIAAWPPTPWPRRATRRASVSGGSLAVCSAVVVARDAVAESARAGAAAALGGGSGSPALVGYLQSASLDTFAPGKPWSMSPDVGTLVDVVNKSGALVFLSLYLHCETQFCVEGDIRGWTDASITPSLWTSGSEDLFGGAHAYAFRPHHMEPNAFWDRSMARVGDGTHWQARTFGFDALRFQHSLKMAMEVQTEISHYSRTLALLYALPAGAPTVAETIPPPNLQSASSAQYEVRSQNGGALSASDVEEYELASGVAGLGELTVNAWGGGGNGVLLRERVLALRVNASVSFSVPVLPSARSVLLRRLVDTRRAVAVARVHVDGVFVGRWVSSDRAFDTIDTFWSEDDFALPPTATHGKSSLRIQLDVSPEPAGAHSRTYYKHQLPAAWVEARWKVLCFPPLEED